MTKKIFEPSIGYFSPHPAVVISCSDKTGKPNIFTVGSVIATCRNPAMIGVAVDLVRYSHKLITETGQFVVNIPTTDQARIVDYCGMVSGRDTNKFAEMKLTAANGHKVNAPIVEEFPINIECVVFNTLHQGSHDWFTGEIVAVDVDETLLDESGQFDPGKMGFLVGSTGGYYALGSLIGQYGFSTK